MFLLSRILELLSGATLERPAPRNIISRTQIDWTHESLTIHSIPSVTISGVADTNSMDGVIDIGHHAIQVSDFSLSDLEVGDIITFRSTGHYGGVIHRIIEIGKDEIGRWYRTKGDNNYRPDPGFIRDEHIMYLCIGVIY